MASRRPDERALDDLAVGACDPHHPIHQVRLTGGGELDLDDVEIDSARIDGVDLAGGRLTRLVVTDSSVHGVSIVEVDLSDGRLGSVDVTDSRLAGCTFDGAVWEDVTMRGTRALRLSCRQAVWRRVTFEDCDLTGIDLTGALLDTVRLTNCRMADADFSAARVRAASFAECDLAGARTIASLRGATVDAITLTSLAGPMAVELGLRLDQSR